jgi:hypothetical protein
VRQIAGKIFGGGGVDVRANGVVYRVEQLAQFAHYRRIVSSGNAIGDDFFHDKNLFVVDIAAGSQRVRAALFVTLPQF